MGFLRYFKGTVIFGVLTALAVIVPLLLSWASVPFDRTVTYTLPTAYTDNTPIPSTDNIVVHVFVCASATDNATCTEIGQSAPNATYWTGPSPQQVGETRWYRAKAESKLMQTMSAFSAPSDPFVLRGKDLNPTGRPVVR